MSPTKASRATPARPLDRVRVEQQKLLVAGGGLFAAYYLSFWLLGIYTARSLASGLAMALGLIGLGLVIRTLAERRVELANVLVALVLGFGAFTSAAFSGGSGCIGFHTIWALPLIYGLFVRGRWPGSVTIAITSLLGGLALLVHDGAEPVRVVQWLALSISAGVFAFVKQTLERRNLEITLEESESAQARLAVADRMASVGLLAAGVAHEINNPMSFVATNVEFAARELEELQRKAGLPPGGELQEAMVDALVGCARVNEIVKTLSRLSRNEGVVEAVDLNRVLGDLVRISRRDLEAIAAVKFEAGTVNLIRGDESRLGQVFLNLLVNGAQAIEERADGPRTLAVRTFPRGPGIVVVEISDSGCGIPQDKFDRIFDPFFTTKPPGKGTGLGLALCAEIVQQHAGTIEVESTPGKGSVFRVVLPAA